MAIVKIIQPPEVAREMYDAVSGKIDVRGNPPEGLILHSAGDADGTWQGGFEGLENLHAHLR